LSLESPTTHDSFPACKADPNHCTYLPLRFQSIATIARFAASSLPSRKDSRAIMAVSSPPASSPTFIPNPTYLFSATVNLGKSLGPIPMVEGGLRIVETITGGTIYGPGFNATIEGGIAAPVLVNNSDGTRIQIPYIYAYGYASDGSPFYMEEAGIGSGVTQNTRLIINVGGEYQGLQSTYVLGQPSVNEERTIALVECFSVPLPP